MNYKEWIEQHKKLIDKHDWPKLSSELSKVGMDNADALALILISVLNSLGIDCKLLFTYEPDLDLLTIVLIVEDTTIRSIEIYDFDEFNQPRNEPMVDYISKVAANVSWIKGLPVRIKLNAKIVRLIHKITFSVRILL